VMRTALALNCQIAPVCRFDRKNYPYPDLPKNYQISQYDQPLSSNGHIDIQVDGQMRRIGIRRVHLEEDTGKSFHVEGGVSLVDYNRSGVPLMEIVTEPDIHTPEEAREYLTTLRAILQYLGVCDGKMEEGSMRAEPNVSVRPKGSAEPGVKVEIKNLSSIRAVYLGIKYEIERQVDTLERGEKILQETRRWDEERGVTTVMRGKESSDDYRYFPEPDLMPLMISPEWVEQVRASLPELPAARRVRLVAQYAIPDYDAGVLTQTKALADLYERCVAAGADAKAASNWLMGDFTRLVNEQGIEVTDAKLTPEGLREMLDLIVDGTISSTIAKAVFEEMFNSGKPPKQIVEERGLVQISDAAAIEKVVDEVMAGNASVVEDIRAGKQKAMGFLVGQVMRAMKGKGNPQMVNEILARKIKG